MRKKPDSVRGQVAQALVCNSQSSTAEWLAWWVQPQPSSTLSSSNQPVPGIFKHALDVFGGHGRAVRPEALPTTGCHLVPRPVAPDA